MGHAVGVRCSRLFLHVGIQAAATATLQSALQGLRPQLRNSGVAIINHRQLKRLLRVYAWAVGGRADTSAAPRSTEELHSPVEREWHRSVA